MSRAAHAALWIVAWAIGTSLEAQPTPVPLSITDYDGNDWYLVRGGRGVLRANKPILRYPGSWHSETKHGLDDLLVLACR